VIRKPRHPLVWVPTLYFAQGLPFAVVAIMAATMYQRLGIPNAEITAWTGLLLSAWTFKPLWSPFLEVIRSKKAVVIAFQLLGGLTLLAVAYSLRLPGFFTTSVAIFALTAFSSATHDIACDGLYIENLSTQQQALYSGWLGAFWNGAKLFIIGGMVWLAGDLEKTMSTHEAWTIVVSIPGFILIGLAVYHLFFMPPMHQITPKEISINFVARTMGDVLLTYIRKPGIWLAILFIILYRASEGLVQPIGRLFLLDAVEKGGLGLSTQEMGILYGTVGTVTFIAGSIFGGYFAALRGLRKSMLIMILAMNVPNLTFWYLSAYHPGADHIYLIGSMLSLEMFGFGFGSTGLTLYMMQVIAPGKYPTAHYALCTGIMNLGLQMFGMPSGKIQSWLGYHDFFILGVAAAIPVLVMSFFMDINVKEKGELVEEEDDAEPILGTEITKAEA
jgi:PAT family beta-lactamase induction signal transducer AmpG